MPSSSPRRSSPAAGGPDERYVIPNLRNACRILKLLGAHPDGLKTAELARDLHWFHPRAATEREAHG